MRILAGDLKYKKIRYVKDDKLRPTRSIVKKSFFDTIRPVLQGSFFLDLFAGVGSVGIEALSRGAKKAIFVDKSYRSVQIIRENAKLLGYEDRVFIIRSDVDSFIEKTDKLKHVDIVYMDAPYGFNIATLVEKIFLKVNKNVIMCVEHGKSNLLKDSFGDFVNIKTRKIGKNILDYFGVADE